VLKNVDQSGAAQRSLEAVRQMGYALSHDELQMGVHGLAVPILGADRISVGSLAAIVPAGRARGLESHVDALWSAAAEIVANYQAPTRQIG
jgi:DNA-binding IclR family transcriptional regulator